jgi:glycosyltransferase involved in cell wall biosynthesis
MISVIVPTFNGAATLPAAIESIRAQNVEVEIIVVDDGSTDDTPRVIASLDVITIRQDNRGPAAARNAGLALATAPLVAFLDDDDVWLPQKLQQQLATLREHPEAAVTLGYTAFQSLDLTTGATTDVAEPHLLYHLGAALCRRETFDRIDAFDPALQSSEDVDWFLRVRDAGLGIVVTRDVVQIHRRDGANMTRGKDLRELGFLEVVKRSLDRRRASGAPASRRLAGRRPGVLSPGRRRDAAGPAGEDAGVPLVSVIVPLYNGARFLGEALDSIAAQEYDNIEVIVVDNGSTDDGARIAESHGVTLLQCERRGAGAARNAGVDAAHGEIITFLDQDDRWLPAKLRRQLEVLAAHPDSICIANQAYFLAPGVTRPKWFARENLLEADHAGWAPSCLAVRRTTFDRVGRFDESMLHASDVDWFARAKELGIAIELPPETLVHRRVHEQNDSANLAAMTEFFNVIRAASARRRNNAEPERT